MARALVRPVQLPSADIAKILYIGNITQSAMPTTVDQTSAPSASHNFNGTDIEYGWIHFTTPQTFAGTFFSAQMFVRGQLHTSSHLCSTVTGHFTLMTVDWNPATLTWNTQPAFLGPTIQVNFNQTIGGNVSGRTEYRLTAQSDTYYGVAWQVTGDAGDLTATLSIGGDGATSLDLYNNGPF